MTAKRFKVTDNTNNPFLCDWNVTDYADGGIVHHPMTSENMANVMCNLLNELAEENENITLLVQHNYEECKRIINNYVDKIKELEKENKELKQKIEALKMEIAELRESENDNYKVTDGLW